MRFFRILKNKLYNIFFRKKICDESKISVLFYLGQEVNEFGNFCYTLYSADGAECYEFYRLDELYNQMISINYAYSIYQCITPKFVFDENYKVI